MMDVVERLGKRLMRRWRTTGTPAEKPTPQHSGKLTRADVLRMIEENGGPQGLQLVKCDLSGIELRFSDIQDELEERGITHTGHIPWYSAETNGVDLRGVNLKGANLSDAKLMQADLRFANLRSAQLEGAEFHDARLDDCILVDARAEGAEFPYAVLARAQLARAQLQEANLFRAQLQGANLFEANLTEAIIRDVNLENGELAEATLTRVNLFGTRMLNTYVRRRQLGNKLVQEEDGYKDPDVHIMPLPWGQYRQAQSIYAHLKNNFHSLGLHEDGSWAYIKERRMERKTKAPWRARQYHGQTRLFGMKRLPTYESYPRWHPLTWWFWFKYLWKWLLDWAAGLSCGYGERPWRTVALAAVLLTVFPLIFWAIGGVGQYDPAVGHDIPSFNFLDYIIYSAGAFVTIGYEELKPINMAARVWTAVEALLGISILALLMFTLGNRISRS